MDELRLGDIIDDHCIKCRRITNHAIVSLMNGEVAKVRCRSCYHDHTYLKEIAPPSKKDLKKAELFNAVLAQVDPASAAAAAEGAAEAAMADASVALEAEVQTDETAADPDAAVPAKAAAKKPRGRVKKA
jgi:hypothetical protein